MQSQITISLPDRVGREAILRVAIAQQRFERVGSRVFINELLLVLRGRMSNSEEVFFESVCYTAQEDLFSHRRHQF